MRSDRVAAARASLPEHLRLRADVLRPGASQRWVAPGVAACALDATRCPGLLRPEIIRDELFVFAVKSRAKDRSVPSWTAGGCAPTSAGATLPDEPLAACASLVG
jgi:hypothetical protein